MQAAIPEAMPPRPLVRVIINLQYLLTSVAPLPWKRTQDRWFCVPASQRVCPYREQQYA